ELLARLHRAGVDREGGVGVAGSLRAVGVPSRRVTTVWAGVTAVGVTAVGIAGYVGERTRLVRGHAMGRHGRALVVDVADRDLAARREAGAGDGQRVTDADHARVGHHGRLEVAGLTIGVTAVGIGGTVRVRAARVLTVAVTAGRVTTCRVAGIAVTSIGVTSIGAPTAGVAALDVPVVRLYHLDRGRGGRRTGGRRDHQLAQGCARGHDQHVGELARVARDRQLGRRGDAVGVDVGDRDLAARREARAGDGQLVADADDGRIGCHDRLE